KGEALEIPHSPEKEPVSCLTDWHYSYGGGFLPKYSQTWVLVDGLLNYPLYLLHFCQLIV
ncbi:hypothetical protein, partial [Escherichia coli]|uniref:hypothetical protein n=1 Tax=Escherichia coli TaxID=562 RepID=UPI0024E0D81A